MCWVPSCPKIDGTTLCDCDFGWPQGDAKTLRPGSKEEDFIRSSSGTGEGILNQKKFWIWGAKFRLGCIRRHMSLTLIKKKKHNEKGRERWRLNIKPTQRVSRNVWKGTCSPRGVWDMLWVESVLAQFQNHLRPYWGTISTWQTSKHVVHQADRRWHLGLHLGWPKMINGLFNGAWLGPVFLSQKRGHWATAPLRNASSRSREIGLSGRRVWRLPCLRPNIFSTFVALKYSKSHKDIYKDPQWPK